MLMLKHELNCLVVICQYAVVEGLHCQNKSFKGIIISKKVLVSLHIFIKLMGVMCLMSLNSSCFVIDVSREGERSLSNFFNGC